MQVHLMIHFVDYINPLSPLFLYHMFLYDQYLFILKGYVRNFAHLGGSIMESYTMEQVVVCFANYVKDGKNMVNGQKHHIWRHY